MAPISRKNGATKKTAPPAKAKQTGKKKAAIVKVPAYVSILKKGLKSMAIMGDRPDNSWRIANDPSFIFDLETKVPRILQKYQSHSLYLLGGTPQLSMDSKTNIPSILCILVPDKDGMAMVPPPFVAYEDRHSNMELNSMPHHNLSWAAVPGLPRVFTLMRGGRAMTTRAAALAANEEEQERQGWFELYTLVPRNKLQLDKQGKIAIEKATYSVTTPTGETIFESYTKGNNLNDHLDRMADSHEAELGEDARDIFKAAVVRAFADARQHLEDQANQLDMMGYDPAFLDSIKTIKIYARGTPEGGRSTYTNRYYPRASEIL